MIIQIFAAQKPGTGEDKPLLCRAFDIGPSAEEVAMNALGLIVLIDSDLPDASTVAACMQMFGCGFSCIYDWHIFQFPSAVRAERRWVFLQFDGSSVERAVNCGGIFRLFVLKKTAHF